MLAGLGAPPPGAPPMIPIGPSLGGPPFGGAIVPAHPPFGGPAIPATPGLPGLAPAGAGGVLGFPPLPPQRFLQRQGRALEPASPRLSMTLGMTADITL